MAADEIHVTMFHSVIPDRAVSSLRVAFATADSEVTLVVPAELLGPLLFGLFAMAPKVTSDLTASQMMTLNSGRPFAIADGRVGLELTLDGAIHLPVLFPVEAIATLRKALDALDEMRRSPPAPPLKQ